MQASRSSQGGLGVKIQPVVAAQLSVVHKSLSSQGRFGVNKHIPFAQESVVHKSLSLHVIGGKSQTLLTQVSFVQRSLSLQISVSQGLLQPGIGVKVH